MESGAGTSLHDRDAPGDAEQTSILVFSRDAALLDTVRKASPRDAAVLHASELEQVSDRLATLHPDVLVLDAGSGADVAVLATQVARQFPDLVIIIAGRREESARLMKLAASGHVYRFLLLPLALGQTRLTLEAALRRHVERAMEIGQPADASGGAAPPRGPLLQPKVLAGAGIVAVAAIAGWMMTGSGPAEITTQNSPVSATEVPEPVRDAADTNPASAELAAANRAMEQQRFVEPAGDNALSHFRAALALDPGNVEAAAGIRSVADRIVERAEAALLAERPDQAVAALEQARNILPDHPRLAFLDAQLLRERERLQLTQARDTDARLRTVLQTAAQRMDAGRLLIPAGQSARDALLEARRIDATDPGVVQGFRDLTSRLIGDAERALSAGQRDQALVLLAAARDLSPSDARVAALERSAADSVATAVTAPAARASTPAAAGVDNAAAGRQRLAEGRLLEPAGDSARDRLLAARTANPNDAEVQQLLASLKDRLIDAGRQALGQGNFAEADRMLTAANDLGVRGSEDSLASTRGELDRQRADAEFRRNVISAGSLQRTRTVPPVYPETARRRGVTGWVDLQFTVTVSGEVADVTVVRAEPAQVFDTAAVNAVSGWRFSPVVRGGTAVPQRAATRIRFDFEN